MISFRKGNNHFNYRAVAVIIDSGHVLLHKVSTDDFWSLPGGRVEMMESSEVAVMREIKEELGLDMGVDRLLWIAQSYFTLGNVDYHELGHYYLMHYTAADLPEKGKEHYGIETHEDLIFKWFSLEELNGIEVYPEFLKEGLLDLPLSPKTIECRRQLRDRSASNSDDAVQGIYLREVQLKDLDDYYHWNLPEREFHKFNGPYFRKKTSKELSEYVKTLERRLKAGEKDVLDGQLIIADSDTDQIIGAVNSYWKSQETLWMEVGIVIFNEAYWGKGIGYGALRLWIDKVFQSNPQLVRLGMTTWSGNERMKSLAEKLGFKCEAIFRMARIVDGEHYDSVSYGILKEEWYERYGNS